MPYKIAGIDVHKRMLAVVVSDVEVDGEYAFERRQFGSKRADSEFCTRSRAASVADGHAHEVPTDGQPSAAPEPVGGIAGRIPHQVVESGLGSAWSQRTADGASPGRRRN